MTTPNDANTEVYWNMEDRPISHNPAIAFGTIKATLQKHGLYGKVSLRVYCEDDFDDKLHYCYCKSGIVLQKRVCKAGFIEVDNMLVDVLTWGLFNPAPSNLLRFNILVSSLEEKDDGSVSLPRSAYYQITSVPNKQMKLAHEPYIGVFWNLDYPCRIFPHISYLHVKSALANQGHHGEVSIWAYCENDDDLLLPSITMIPTGNRTARFKQMLKDILLWALLNPPVRYTSKVPPCLMVISDISGNRQFAVVLQTLVSRNYTVLLTVSDEIEYLSSVWLYPNLKEITSNHAATEGLRSPADAKREGLRVPKTGIFWNFAATYPTEIDKIKSALANEGYRCEVSIQAYSDMRNRVRPCFEQVSISLQKRVSRDDATFLELDTMLADILVWAVHNPAPSNLMVISNIISHETELLRLLHDLKSKGYSIFIAHAEEAIPPMLPPVSLEWHLNKLLAGRKPISLTNYSRDKINMIRNDISVWRTESHENFTGIFWDIDDCPVPDGLCPERFIYGFAEILSSGFYSVMAYGKRRNLPLHLGLLKRLFPFTFVPTGNKDERIKKIFEDIFLWALDRPQTSRSTVVVITESFPDNMYDALAALESRNCELVFVDPHAVCYVKSVWLLPSLFGGGNPIDLRGRKKASKQCVTKWKITS